MGGSKTTVQSNQKTQIPKEIRERGTQLTQGAMNHYYDPAQKFQHFDVNKYGGVGESRTGQLNEGHQAAGQQFGDAATGYQPYFNAANQTLYGTQGRNQASGVEGPDFTNQNLQRFFNPFQQNVINQGVRQIGDNMTQGRLQNQSRAAQAGAFGGARHGVLDSQNQANAMQTMSDFIGKQLNEGYGSAVNQYNTNFGQGLQANEADNRSKQQNFNTDTSLAQIYSNLAQSQQGMQIGAGKANMELGNIVTAQDQAERDNAYKSYTEERDYPMEVYERLAAMNAMQPSNRQTSGTSTQSQSGGWLGPALGAAGAILSDVAAKEDIRDINPESVLSKFAKVPPVSFKYSREALARHPEETGEGKRTGFTAQALEKVMPDAVKSTGEFKSVDVGNVLGSLVAAVHGLEKRTRKLK